MIILFTLMLWIIWLAIALSLYSNFLPYFSLLKDVKQYNMAYYGANTAIERSLLVLRQQESGFEWKGWRQWWDLDVLSDNSFNNFSYFTKDTTLLWNVQSRSNNLTIPLAGMWNSNYYSTMEWLTDYNMLSYGKTQTIKLWVDSTATSHSYQKDTERTQYDWESISLEAHIPLDIREIFAEQTSAEESLLCDGWSVEECDADNDSVVNDILISWWLNGFLNYWWENYNFSILPRNIIGRLGDTDTPIVFNNDEAIRETDINEMSEEPGKKSIVWSDNINPLISLSNIARENHGSWHLLIGSETIFDGNVHQSTFSELFRNSDVVDLELKLSLLQRLLTRWGQIYPFINYRLVTDTESLSQPFFYIQWTSKVGDYSVQMNVRKPVDKSNGLDSFTVIF